ncbi:MAG TPA: M20 family metallopeptidase [Proteiniphilum sp.]|nr:M20 family metallopeptidase [Proteiniphilum sp.]
MDLLQQIRHLTEQLFPEVVGHYRHLHSHPELSYREQETAAYIAAFLQKEGISFRSGIGGYGVVAEVKGEKELPESCIAFVADMDALPVQEENYVSYRSLNEGVMHACGHDAQAAALMGAVKMLHSLRQHFAGTLLFVFQPGEEQSPGGASLMLRDNLFGAYNPRMIIKQHAYIDLPAGHVAFQSGTVMASADEVHLTVKGQGGHGALPHELNDTVLAASQIVVAMQQLASRRSNPFHPIVLSFGRFIAAGATNVIPPEVTLAGSLRCMNEEERRKMLGLIPQIASDTAAAYGCRCEAVLPEGYPCVISDETVTREVKVAAAEWLGAERVGEYPRRMTADDFGFFTQQYPCCYYRFGVSPTNKRSGALHSGSFLIDEEALRTATGLLSAIALKCLKMY